MSANRRVFVLTEIEPIDDIMQQYDVGAYNTDVIQ